MSLAKIPYDLKSLQIKNDRSVSRGKKLAVVSLIIAIKSDLYGGSLNYERLWDSSPLLSRSRRRKEHFARSNSMRKIGRELICRLKEGCFSRISFARTSKRSQRRERTDQRLPSSACQSNFREGRECSKIRWNCYDVKIEVTSGETQRRAIAVSELKQECTSVFATRSVVERPRQELYTKGWSKICWREGHAMSA